MSANEGGNQDLIRVIQEVVQEKPTDADREQQVDKIAEDIYAKLLDELKSEMDLLLLNDPRVNSLARPTSKSLATIEPL